MVAVDGDGVSAEDPGIDDGIGAAAAREDIVAGAAPKLVGGGVAGQGIGAVAAISVFDGAVRRNGQGLPGQGAGGASVQVDRAVRGDGGGVEGVEPAAVGQGVAARAGELGVFVGIIINVVPCQRVAIEPQRPIIQGALVQTPFVGDRKGPRPVTRLAPMVGAAEGEVDVVLAGPGLIGEDAFGAVRRGQGDDKVADVGMREVQVHLDLIDFEGSADENGIGGRRMIVDGGVGRASGGDLKFVGVGALPVPCLGQPDGGMGVDQPEAEVVADMKGAAVPVVGAIPRPTRIRGIDLTRRIGEDLLHVAVAEVGVGLQHERHDTGRDRRRRRGAAEGAGIVVAAVTGRADTVGGPDAAAVAAAGCPDQDGRAGGAVIADVASVGYGGNGDGVT